MAGSFVFGCKNPHSLTPDQLPPHCKIISANVKRLWGVLHLRFDSTKSPRICINILLYLWYNNYAKWRCGGCMTPKINKTKQDDHTINPLISTVCSLMKSPKKNSPTKYGKNASTAPSSPTATKSRWWRNWCSVRVCGTLGYQLDNRCGETWKIHRDHKTWARNNNG